jgi:hypothetical protein
MVMVEVEREIPVRRRRVVPGYWYVTAESSCRMELYDAKNPDGGYVAAVSASGSDSGRQSEKRIFERLARKTVEDAVSSLLPDK